MLKRQSKTELKQQNNGPPRILVVDDNPDSARLVAKLFRRAGFEVAEVGDHQVALMTLMNEPAPISAVIASFSGTGNAASLKLLDAVRHTPDARVNSQRMVLVLDSPRQHMFSWQSGADAVLMRPYPAAPATASPGQRDDTDSVAEPRRVLRGASFATRGRLRHERSRHAEVPGFDAGFCGFRSCAV